MAQTELRFSVRSSAAHFFIFEVVMGALFFILILSFILIYAEINNPRPTPRPNRGDQRRTIEDDIDEFLEALWTKIKRRFGKK